MWKGILQKADSKENAQARVLLAGVLCEGQDKPSGSVRDVWGAFPQEEKGAEILLSGVRGESTESYPGEGFCSKQRSCSEGVVGGDVRDEGLHGRGVWLRQDPGCASSCVGHGWR
ncbi:MAG: hypothetical protein DRP01_06705 [Archaeoglobales archaeon]|nr:MAG: hypothetical protein DRP01_06705 [Archaeoglobales archaeon]